MRTLIQEPIECGYNADPDPKHWQKVTLCITGTINKNANSGYFL
jgi:hypothetical protein